MGDGIEIERKFVLGGPPSDAVLVGLDEPVHIEQRYLASPRLGLTRRVRAMTSGGETRYVYTEKEKATEDGAPASSGAVMRLEREEDVSAERYQELCRETDDGYRLVVKDRWRVPSGDLVFELDHVTEPVDFWVVEVELEDPDTPVVVPPDFGPFREDPECSMAALARGTYRPHR